MGDDDFRSSSEPLDGPGPSDPADLGTPVSATVGVTEGIFTVGSVGLGATTGGGKDELIGIGAGAWFREAGFKGGERDPTGGGDARIVGEVRCVIGEEYPTDPCVA